MKHYIKYFLGLAALPMMVACSQDDVLPGGGDDIVDNTEGVYMSLNLSFGQATRSYTDGPGTSNDGEELGTIAENKVSKVLLVLARKSDNGLIAYSQIPGDNLTPMTSGDQQLYKATGKFTKTTLNEYYTTTADRDVNVFVFCNPTSSFEQVIKTAELGDTGWTDAQISLSENGTTNPWTMSTDEKAEGKFFMSNYRIATRSLPAKLDDWNDFMTLAKPFDLSGFNNAGQSSEVDNHTGRGAIEVHRLAARFDFMDGSTDKSGNGVGDFTYNVVFDRDNEPIVQCRIQEMALVNMSNKEYVLERVSSNGLNQNFSLCGPEMPWYSDAIGTVIEGSGNYVVSSWSQEKATGITSEFGNYFLYPFFGSNGKVSPKGAGWDWIRTTDNFDAEGYKRWRYLSENTLPEPASKQANGQSTGVVFKAKMIPTEALKNSTDKWEKMLYQTLSAPEYKDTYKDHILYSYAGSLYVGWENVQAAALAAAGYDATKGQDQHLDTQASLYLACYGRGGVGTVKNDAGEVVFTDEKPADTSSCNYLWTLWDATGRQLNNELTAFKLAATTTGFTLYQSDSDNNGDWGYWCYYYYWNRHNNNNQAGVMGPMEFAVVRNNVYKLAVTKLSTLGHPRLPENDPSDPTPDTPDESADIYMTVSVKVLPWVVRINNIEF